jgi:hypothetical protein
MEDTVTLVVTDGDRRRTAHFLINGVPAQKVRFGDRRRSFVFFSIYDGERGPELTASCGGLLTADQMAAYSQVRGPSSAGWTPARRASSPPPWNLLDWKRR